MGIYLESARILLGLGSKWNGWNMVGIWLEWLGVRVKMAHLSLKCHSYHIPTVFRPFCSDPLGMCGGVSSTRIVGEFCLPAVDSWYFVTQSLRKITEVLSSLYLGWQSFPKPATGPWSGGQAKSPMVGVHQMIRWSSNVLGRGIAARWL